MQPGGSEYPRTKVKHARVRDLGIMLESVMSTERHRPVFPIFERAKRPRSRSPPVTFHYSHLAKRRRTSSWSDDMYDSYDIKT